MINPTFEDSELTDELPGETKPSIKMEDETVPQMLPTPVKSAAGPKPLLTLLSRAHNEPRADGRLQVQEPKVTHENPLAVEAGGKGEGYARSKVSTTRRLSTITVTDFLASAAVHRAIDAQRRTSKEIDMPVDSSPDDPQEACHLDIHSELIQSTHRRHSLPQGAAGQTRKELNELSVDVLDEGEDCGYANGRKTTSYVEQASTYDAGTSYDREEAS